MITLNVGASNAPKCLLNIGVYIVQKIVAKPSNTSTMLFPPVAKTLSNFRNRSIMIDDEKDYKKVLDAKYKIYCKKKFR
jgi:hypothetical protein